MKFAARLKPCHTLIDLTPLVDVIFLMLIFFMVTSDILPLKALSIQNPELPAMRTPANLAQLVVIMDKDQVIYIGSKKEIVDMNSVKEHLTRQIAAIRAEHPAAQPTIVLSCDKHVDYGAFLRLFHQVQECTPKIRLAFSQANSE